MANWLRWTLLIVGIVVAVVIGDSINRWWQLNAWKRRNRRPRDPNP